MRNDELLVNKISSQIDLHEKFGGVVPEVASRAHAEMIEIYCILPLTKEE